MRPLHACMATPTSVSFRAELTLSFNPIPPVRTANQTDTASTTLISYTHLCFYTAVTLIISPNPPNPPVRKKGGGIHIHHDFSALRTRRCCRARSLRKRALLLTHAPVIVDRMSSERR